jgi:hypothetical protein
MCITATVGATLAVALACGRPCLPSPLPAVALACRRPYDISDKLFPNDPNIFPTTRFYVF